MARCRKAISKFKSTPLLRTSIKEVRYLPNEKWNVISEKSNGNQINGIFDEIFCTLPSHRLNNINWINLNNQELLEDLTEVDHPPCLSFIWDTKENKFVIPRWFWF